MPANFRDGKPADFPFQEEKESRNADRSRGFLPVLWPEMRPADSDFEVFRSALKSPTSCLEERQNAVFGVFSKSGPKSDLEIDELGTIDLVQLLGQLLVKFLRLL